MEPATDGLLDQADLDNAFSASNVRLERSYAYAGEEDAHGDAYRLIETASVIEPVAAQLRQFQDQEGARVAILSARAHEPAWLARSLQRRLRLRHRLEPELIQCVYSRGFESALPAAAPPPGLRWTTPARKAHAFGELVRASSAQHVIFFDDVAANLQAAQAYAAATFSHLLVQVRLVPFELAADACVRNGVDVRELLHFGCRGEAPSALAQRLLDRVSPAAQGRLGGYERESTAVLDLPP